MFLEQSKNSPYGVFNDDQLVYLCIDLFMAGSETTSKSSEVVEILLVDF